MSNRENYYRQLWSIAIPITLQSLVQSSLNTVDTVMIGRLGEAAIAGVGLANQFFFIYLMLLFGINSGVSIFFSQFHGKGDYASIRKCFGYAVKAGSVMALPFAVIGFIFAPAVIRLFIDDPVVIGIGVVYLRLLAVSFFITSISFSYATALRSIGYSKVPMIISLIVLTTNTFLNYLLIFGVWGFPKLGVAGAAWATVFSRVLELVIFFLYVQKRHSYLHGTVHEVFGIDKALAQRIWHTILPVILNETLWGAGVSVYLIAYGHLGTDALATFQISNTILRLFFVLNMGIANACQVMIGYQLGSNAFDTAIVYARRFVKLGLMIGVGMGLVMALVGPLVLPLFNVSAAVALDARYTLWSLGVMMAPKTLSAIYIVGILRGGGDTRFSLYLEILNVYLIGIPLSFLGAAVLQLPIYWVVLLTNVEEVIKAIVGTIRLLTNKWAKNVVSDL